MGKASRAACIFVPAVLSLATFVALTLIAVQGFGSSGALASEFYYVRLNTWAIADGHTIAGEDNPTHSNVSAFYDIYMWNYCSGTENGTITHCSPHTVGYAFNPQQVFNFEPQIDGKLFMGAINDAISAYQRLAKGVFAVYFVAQAATLLTLLMALFAICSRWGSFFTWIVAAVASVAVILWAVLVTVMFAGLDSSFKTIWRPYNIGSWLGRDALIVTWVAAACSIAAAATWFITICCCSGKERHAKSKNSNRAPTFGRARGYEQVPEPLMLVEKQRAGAMLEPHFDEMEAVNGGRSDIGYETYRDHMPGNHSRRGSYAPDIALTKPSYESSSRRHSYQA